MSSGIGILKNHTTPQYNESNNLNEMNISVDNGDANCDSFYINIFTGSESKNHNYIDYKNKTYEISTNTYLMVNNGLPDGVGIDVMLPEYSLTNIPTLNTIMNITKF